MKFMDVQAVDGVIRMAKIAKGADYFGTDISEDTAFALMDRYLELGGNTIDTARIYGKAGPEPESPALSEGVVGRWMKSRGNRSSIVLVTKGAHPDRAALTKSRICKEVVETELCTSLEQLGVDHVDVYFLHRDNPDMPAGEIIDLMDEQVRAGKIRALGISNWTVSRINEANAYAKANGRTPITISQIQWGLAWSDPAGWNDPTIVCMNDTEYAGYLANKIPVMGFAPQGGGYFTKMLAGQPVRERFRLRYDNPVNRARLERVKEVCEATGQSAAAIALAFLTSNPVESAAVIGCSTVAQLEDSMSSCDLTLDAETVSALLR